MNTLQQDSDKKLLLVAKSENMLLSKYSKHSHENNKGTPGGFGQATSGHDRLFQRNRRYSFSIN